MTTLLRLLAVAVVVSIASWTFGWWAPAMTAVLFGYVFAQQRAVPTLVGVGSMLGWVILLLVVAAIGRFGAVAGTVGALFGRGAAMLVLLTLLIPLLFGLTGAELGRWLRIHALAPDPAERGT